MFRKAQTRMISGAVSNFIRQKNSPNGNPRWTVVLHNGFIGSTAPNSGLAYAITGREEFLIISYHVTPSGRVVITDLH